MVLECLELTETAKRGGRDYLNLRGEVLPLLDLTKYFAIPRKAPVKRQNVVVVSVEGRKFGLVVDGLKGELQAVIKPLAPCLVWSEAWRVPLCWARARWPWCWMCRHCWLR